MIIKKNLKTNHTTERALTNLSSSIKTLVQQGLPTTQTEITESTLPSDETLLPPESITTPILNNLQRFTNENALLKEQIQNLAAEIEGVKMFVKEQLLLLKKTQKDKSD